jgi:endonuclease III
LTAGTDAEAAGRQLKELTQAIIDAQDIAAETKKELVELIQALSVEIVRSRKKSVIASLLGTIEERAKGLNAIVQLVSSLKGVIGQLFGGDLNV